MSNSGQRTSNTLSILPERRTHSLRRLPTLMTDPTSPATRLQDVLVVHEQSGREWRPGRAAIRDGRIVIRSTTIPPNGLLDQTTATYTITAHDGGGRLRRFPHLVFAHTASHPPTEYVFD